MPRRSSLGMDPLDWIGMAPDGAPARENGNGGGLDGDRGDDAAARRAQRAPAAASAVTPSPTPGNSGGSPAPVPAATRLHKRRRDVGSSRLPAVPAPDPASLERELLLMDVRELSDEPSRRFRLNQVLLFLIFAFALCGSAALFFREARSRWNDQVLTLQGTIEKLEMERRENDTLFRKVLVSKDRVIGEKEKIIQDLQALHTRSVADLRETWNELRELQQRYSSFFKIVFSSVGDGETPRESE